MNGRFVFRVALGIILVATLVGLGIYVYDAGLAQGIAEGTGLATREPSTNVAPYAANPYGPYGYGPWHHGWGAPFGFFHIFVPLLWFFLIFVLVRALIWRPYRGWHGGWTGGGDRAPTRFEEWHRRAHEADAPKAE